MTKSGPLLSDPNYLELKDRFSGLVVLLGSMAFCLGLSFWAKELPRSERQLKASPVAMKGIVGWPHNVDALGTLDGARRSSRPHELREIVLEGVKSDGTIDVVTGGGSLSYLFHNGPRKPKPRKPNEPISASKKDDEQKAAKPQHCPRQVVRVRSDGIDPQAELKENRCPEIDSEPLPPPTCGPRELWARAITKGASIRQLAHIQYYRSKAGPAWMMTLPGHSFRMVLSGDCQRELERRDWAQISK